MSFDSATGESSGATGRFQGASWKKIIPNAGVSYSQTNINNVRRELANSNGYLYLEKARQYLLAGFVD